MVEERVEQRDGMCVHWNAAIPMGDGVVMRADVYRPPGEGAWPVVLTYGPYGKGLAFQEGNAHAWNHLTQNHPEVLDGSSNKYQSWELVDPEKWVPDGYVCVRVDSRGTGCSPGFVDPWSPRETQDLYECIEWCGVQPWSSGKVALNGISYYAMNAWQVAALEPPHLTAMVCWEGSGDYYREATRHGGIASQFLTNWFPRAVYRSQYGVGERGHRSKVTGELVCGPEQLSEEVLEQNRIDMVEWILSRPLDSQDHRDRSADFTKVKVPFLSAANWGGVGLHPRGNFEGYLNAPATQKWLEAHGGAHWESFYTTYGETLQKRFLGHFLKGEDTGWLAQPPVLLQVRHHDHFEERAEREWPLARTRWTKFYPDPRDGSLRTDAPTDKACLEYATQGDGLMFLTPPMAEEMEITGPVAARLLVSSRTDDADVFLVLRLFTPDMREITWHGSNDPRTPAAMGWLRASQRKLDPARSLPWRPWHTHDQRQPLTPGKPEALDIEIWPTSVVIPKGWRLGLSVRGKDYVYPGPPLAFPGVKYSLTGVGPFLHEDPRDRPPAVFDTTNTVHFDPADPAWVLLPIIPRT